LDQENPISLLVLVMLFKKPKALGRFKSDQNEIWQVCSWGRVGFYDI